MWDVQGEYHTERVGVAPQASIASFEVRAENMCHVCSKVDWGKKKGGGGENRPFKVSLDV